MKNIPINVYLMIMFCMTLIGHVSAQGESSTLLELIKQAQAYRYENKVNELNKTGWESEASASYRLNPMEINLQYGNNDGPERDAFIQVTQDLGRPWNIGRNRRFAQLGIDYTNQNAKKIKHEIAFAVSSAYYDYLSSAKMLELLSSLDETLAKAIKVNENKFESGALSHAEFLLLRQLHSGILNKFQLEQEYHKGLESELKSYCGVDSIIVANDSLFLLQWNPLDVLSPSLLMDQEILLEQIDQESSVISGYYHPQIQLGYFYQTLGNVPGHQGLLGGLSVPLVFTGRKNALTQNKLNYQRTALEIEFQRNRYHLELDALNQNLAQMHKVLLTFHPDPAACSKGLEQMQQQYIAGEISMFDYIRYADIIIDGASSEIQMMTRYNQLIVRHRYLTQPF